MSEQYRSTVHDLTAGNQYCPRCGRPYTPVEYYTGKRISESSTRLSANYIETQTTYRDVQKHTGGICRYCDAEKQKRLLKKLILVGTAGTVFFVIGLLILTNVIALDPMKFGGLGILLVTFGGVAMLLGFIAILIRAMMNPGSNINYISLYTMFTDRLGKEGGKRSGLEYLSAIDGQKLRPTR